MCSATLSLKGENVYLCVNTKLYQEFAWTSITCFCMPDYFFYHPGQYQDHKQNTAWKMQESQQNTYDEITHPSDAKHVSRIRKLPTHVMSSERTRNKVFINLNEWLLSVFVFFVSHAHSVSRHFFYFHGNGYPTSNIKAITICYTAIIAIIENSRAVKETGTLSADALHTRGLSCAWGKTYYQLPNAFPFSKQSHSFIKWSPNLLCCFYRHQLLGSPSRFHSCPSWTPPYITPIFHTPSPTITSLLVFSHFFSLSVDRMCFQFQL